MSTSKYCPHTYQTSLPPCISLGVIKYNYLKDLLNNNKGSNQELMIAHSIECIEFKNKAIDIKNGTILDYTMLTVKVSEPMGINPNKFNDIIGMKVSYDISQDCPLEWKHFD